MSDFDSAVHAVCSLKPGQRIDIDLRHVRRNSLADDFTTADWIMENIVGSAYEFLYYQSPHKCATTFERLLKPLEGDEQSYVSPDRRHWFDAGVDGLYRRAILALAEPR
jgi:hypothetical protein